MDPASKCWLCGIPPLAQKQRRAKDGAAKGRSNLFAEAIRESWSDERR
jgi:hypothetical protein